MHQHSPFGHSIRCKSRASTALEMLQFPHSFSHWRSGRLCDSPLVASLDRPSPALAASAGGVLAALRGAVARRICTKQQERQTTQPCPCMLGFAQKGCSPGACVGARRCALLSTMQAQAGCPPECSISSQGYRPMKGCIRTGGTPRTGPVLRVNREDSGS